jgi:hypothetical protein
VRPSSIEDEGEGPSFLSYDASEMKRVDRDVIRLTVILWSAHFALIATRSIFAGKYDDFGSMSARLITSVAAALLVLGIARLLRNLKTESALKRFGWATSLSLPAALFTSVLTEFLFLLFLPGYRHHGGQIVIDRVELAFDLSFFLWVFVAWAALYASAVAAADMRRRDRLLQKAETEASRAQLLALKLQMQPHFLFNTLNTLSGLIALDRKRQAEDLILNLSSYLRSALADSPAHCIPLADELQAQEAYLAIEKARFTQRLRVRVNVPPDLGAALVPSLILQPLIENAIKHSAGVEGPIELRITAERSGGELRLHVENSFAPTQVAKPDGFGIGLSNVRQRLNALYGMRGALEASPAGAGWWRSSINLPLEEKEG